ncbi:helix-turn-helix transcriptional regulator [Mycolicibacterium pulveris]|uniref:Uncharacterized protein n=1 Tax=Mycolicibacterium pulveris TaxID=36813 RepID=A0A7I7US43_MYCPV|nr:helix-turn-helix transcriptional regulator [Mycolicibacterium pulveris]MCV6982157.1 helix-turn-helix transcriptional regulator [Mycolicibacterium pulveris]BBY84197.1 hypothetical protein MPUL_53550 [Mycolicibacterium pulveris]
MTTQMDWVPDTEDFSVRLALIRHGKRWNMKEAALACGVKPQSWREWELHGRRPQDYEAICKQIAQVAQCNLVWLMTGHRLLPPDPPAAPANPFSGPQAGGAQVHHFRPRTSPIVSAPRSDRELTTVQDGSVDEDAARYVALAEGAPTASAPTADKSS